MGDNNKPDDRKRPPRRHVTSEEKTWRSYSKSLIVELKEKLAARRARTLGLLSEGADSSAFCEVDTESDGLDDTSSRSHDVQDHLHQDPLEEGEPEMASLSETSSISDTMDYSYLNADYTNRQDSLMQRGNMSPTRQLFFTTTATECHSFSPPRSDNTTMTSAKFRFDGDKELVSVGTECDELNDSCLNGKLVSSNNDIHNLSLDNMSLDALSLTQKDPASKLPQYEMSFNDSGAEIDSIEATYSSAVEYFFGTSKERPQKTALSVSKPNELCESSNKNEPCSFNKSDLIFMKAKDKALPVAPVTATHNNTPDTACSIGDSLRLISPCDFEHKSKELMSLGVDSNAFTLNHPDSLLSKCSVPRSNDVFVDDATTASQGAGDFKFTTNASKVAAKTFCHSLIAGAEALLTSELSLTTYKCTIEEILRTIKSNNSFYAEIDKSTIELLENAFDQNSFTTHVDQNISSNSGSDQSNLRPVKGSSGNESEIAKFQRNQRLQSCLKKARLVSALQLNHDSAATKMGKVVTKQAYDKAVREFEALVTRFASTELNTQTTQSKISNKHPHVISLPPFGSSRSSISSKTFIYNSREKKDKDSDGEVDGTEHKIKRSSTFVMEENADVDEARFSCETSLNPANLALNSSSTSTEKKAEILNTRDNNASHQETLPSLERKPPASGGDDSDSESGESHESGFCSNQVYTSTLLTQLLDYSSQDENIADLEDSRYQEEKGGHLGIDMEATTDSKVVTLEGASSQMQAAGTENEIKEQDGSVDKTEGAEHIIVPVRDATAPEEIAIYESDFETGSDSDTNCELFSSKKNPQPSTQRDMPDYASCKEADTALVGLATKKEDESIVRENGVQEQKTGSVEASNTPLPFLDSPPVQSGLDTESTNKSDDHEHGSDDIPHCSSSLANKSKECFSKKEDKPVRQQILTKKSSRPFLPQIDFSSSDDDSADDVSNELNPSEILRKRQIEQVDVQLEQLKELAKRKRKSRYPHKQSNRNEEKVDVSLDTESPQDSDQSDNFSKDLKDYHDYKDPKLLSTCLDLLTRRRKLKNHGESLPSCVTTSGNQNEEKWDSKDLDSSSKTFIQASDEIKSYTSWNQNEQKSGSKDLDSSSKTFIQASDEIKSYTSWNQNEEKSDSKDLDFSSESFVQTSDEIKSSPVQQSVDTQASVELTYPAPPDINSLTLSIAPEAAPLPFEKPTNFSEMLSQSTFSATLIPNQDDCSRELKEIEIIRETTELENINVTDSIDVELGRIRSSDESTLLDAQKKELLNDILSSSGYKSNICTENDKTLMTFDTTQINEIYPQPIAAERVCCEKLNYSKAALENMSSSKSNALEKKTSLDNSPTCITFGTNGPHRNLDEASVLAKHQFKDPLSQTLSMTSKDEEDNTNKNIAELSIKIGDANELSNNLESYHFPTNHQIHSAVFTASGNLYKEESSEIDNSWNMDFKRRFPETSLTGSLGNQRPSAPASNLLYKVGEVKASKGYELQQEWRTIGTVNDFNKFLFESQGADASTKQHYVNCVCNPDYQQFSDLQHQTSSSNNQQNIEMPKISESKDCQSLQLCIGNEPSLAFKDQADTNNISSPRYARPQESTPDINFQIIGRLAVLENMLSDCAHSQKKIETHIKEVLHREQSAGADQATTKIGPDNPGSSSGTSMVPIHETGATRSSGTTDQSFLKSRQKLTNAATQTLAVVSHACQTEEAWCNETALDLEHSLRSCIDDNFVRFRCELEAIRSEVKVEAEKNALVTSRCEDVMQMMRESNENLNKKTQELEGLMEDKFGCFKNTVSSCLEASVDAIKEKVTDEIKGQMSDMLQTIRTELASSIPALSVDINAVQQSLEWSSKMKEMFEASQSKMLGEDEHQNPQIKKGVDVETMKMRIVELTSQRDAEKVFHKITRQSLRALERDHERLREEFLGFRLRRDRRTQESDPRRQFQNFISQQCSYCFNNERPRFGQQTQAQSKQDKQKSSVKTQPTSTEQNNVKAEKQGTTREAAETNEQNDCQRSIGPDAVLEKSMV